VEAARPRIVAQYPEDRLLEAGPQLLESALHDRSAGTAAPRLRGRIDPIQLAVAVEISRRADGGPRGDTPVLLGHEDLHVVVREVLPPALLADDDVEVLVAEE